MSEKFLVVRIGPGSYWVDNPTSVHRLGSVGSPFAATYVGPRADISFLKKYFPAEIVEIEVSYKERPFLG